MSKKNRSLFLLVNVLVIAAFLLTACQPAATPTKAPEQPQVTQPPAAEQTQPPAQPPEAKKFTIGISNPFVSSEWRTQMIKDLEEVNAEYMAQGITTELIIESYDTDVQGQIQQIRNLMNKGVDAIIVNPSDAAGLNAVLQEAIDAGILVVSVDQEVSAKGAINVAIDQAEWARISARWLVEKLGGQGNVVMINGITGHPANEARVKAATEVFQQAGINILNSVEGKWDQATGQQKMADMLAAYPKIDGVWAQDGVSLGALRAVQAANPEVWPVMVGEARAGYLKAWYEILQTKSDFESIGVINPPGQCATGLRVAVKLLQGKKLKEGILQGAAGNTIYVPIPGIVTKRNFETIYETVKDKSDWYTLDSILSDAEVDAFFEGAPPQKKFTIGISNPFVSSEWRTQMIKDFEEVNAEYMAQGITTELIIESYDTDVQGQIQQIRNLMNKGVDAIIVNPSDAAGLNAVLQEAIDAGILVVSVDQEVSAKGAINVAIDQAEWARISARWLVEKLGGQGNVVMINGITGHPANEARVKAATEVFQQAGINILNSVEGKWDQATGQQKMADMLAAYPKIDGVWAQDGVSLGALRAVQAANPEVWPVMVGEARAGYLKAWYEILQTKPDFESIGVINPPGQCATGLRVAIKLLLGKQLKDGILKGAAGNTLYVPIPGVVTSANFLTYYEMVKDKTDWYTLDSVMNDLEVSAFFK